eukprot:jgi/Mesvir1/5071/Mv06280-RA.1
MRTSILNQIDSWWRNAGALALVKGVHLSEPWRAFADLVDADYRVSGLPQPSCGSGYGAVFFNVDPASKNAQDKLRIVDPYIVAADGSVVENPNAVYGPVCARSKMSKDLFGGPSGYAGGGLPSNDGMPLPNFHSARLAGSCAEDKVSTPDDVAPQWDLDKPDFTSYD